MKKAEESKLKKSFGLFTYSEVKKSKVLQLLVSDETKSCPFNFSHQLMCSTCKHSICLISEDEMREIQNSGHSQIKDKVFVCASKLDAVITLLKLQKSIKGKKNAKTDVETKKTAEKNEEQEEK